MTWLLDLVRMVCLCGDEIILYVIGTVCPPGMSYQPDLLRNACPVGQYSLEATYPPIDCPAGTYNPLTGRGDPSFCLTCPAGYYCEASMYNLHVELTNAA